MEKRNRKLNKKGGLSIPSDIRIRYGYTGGVSVSMEVNDDGSITLRPNNMFCYFCGSDAEKTHKGTPICKSCGLDIGKITAPKEPKATRAPKKSVK